MKVLVVGPSPDRSRGGMATVIQEIRDDKKLNKEFDIDIFDSFIDSNIIVRGIYSVWAYCRFLVTMRHYDVYHIHVASRMSTFRKGYYVRAAKRWGKKVILHIHGAEYMEFFSELSAHRRKAVLNILKSADMVIALSQDWKDKFVSTFGLKNCEALENGINIKSLKPAITESSKYRNSFACLGRLGKRKGTYDLIDAVEIAVKDVPTLKCYLAGDGEIEKAKELIREKKLENNIETVGWIDSKEKVRLLDHVSTVVLPSYNEGLPMSILEGMACGKAIISTTVGAIPEVVKEENGILITPGNVKALANAIIKCCQDKNILEEMQKNNINLIKEHYSIEVMHSKLKSIYTLVEGAI